MSVVTSKYGWTVDYRTLKKSRKIFFTSVESGGGHLPEVWTINSDLTGRHFSILGKWQLKRGGYT